MNWQEKIRVIQSDLPNHEEIDADFYVEDHGIDFDILEKLKKDFPFLGQMIILTS